MIDIDSTTINTEQKDTTLNAGQSLHDIDELTALSQRRLARLKAERSREASRGICRLLRSTRSVKDGIGDRLVLRLDELIRTAENQLEALEAKRAEVLLAHIDRMFLPAADL